MKKLAILIAASAVLAGGTSAWALNTSDNPVQKNLERTVQRTDLNARQVLMDDGLTYRVPDRNAMRELRPGDTVIIDSLARPDGTNVITSIEPLNIQWIGVPPGFG